MHIFLLAICLTCALHYEAVSSWSVCVCKARALVKQCGWKKVAAEDSTLSSHTAIGCLSWEARVFCYQIQNHIVHWVYYPSQLVANVVVKFLFWHFLLACDVWKSPVRCTQACAQVRVLWGIPVAINQHYLVPQETTFYCFSFFIPLRILITQQSETKHASCLTTQIKI